MMTICARLEPRPITEFVSGQLIRVPHRNKAESNTHRDGRLGWPAERVKVDRC